MIFINGETFKDDDYVALYPSIVYLGLFSLTLYSFYILTYN